ncbi:MAG TPA: alpha/beta hydrolase [Trinickia sp.]|jgi:predicted alpha/beta hydrolase family esterase|uniref:RBBP9/YdeN family alpha/beta hydrolase n=1 Tax=Trinickia sp. TaxID=2571163 RepID=UPI002C2C868B|nr:alpha/beta hydrolase [Trinickia sp.]HTI18724.1 alpha/beta hydrolase [Trinickia sp.]
MSSCMIKWPPRLVVVPGLYGSDEAHWQSWLERQFMRPIRIDQQDWSAPDLQGWTEALAIRLSREQGPFVLAAHSFGCLVAAQAIARGLRGVVGALLVAPANPARFSVEDQLHSGPLGVTAIVVGSDDDPWFSADGAQTLARGWGASFVNLGKAGHINTASGFGPWPRAKYWVDTLAHWAAPRCLPRDDTPATVEAAPAVVGACAPCAVAIGSATL